MNGDQDRRYAREVEERRAEARALADERGAEAAARAEEMNNLFIVYIVYIS
jgi:hypothetical protein